MQSAIQSYAKIQKITLPLGKRIISISDIHGELDLFKRLLEKVNFNADDILILPGDLYTKGSQNHETLKFLMKFCTQENVFPLRGNCDRILSYLSSSEVEWLENLPDIIDAGEYVFVHSGVDAGDLSTQRPAMQKKFQNFMETAPAFDRWLIVGHWPVGLYCHQIPCANPIINEEKRIISIDGGHCNKPEGQLNAFIIRKQANGDAFSFVSVDKHPLYEIKKSQAVSGGTISITYVDRQVEVLSKGDALSRVKHLKTNAELIVPTERLWIDKSGSIVICDMATDYFMPVEAGEMVGLVAAFEDRVYVKKDGVSGWVWL